MQTQRREKRKSNFFMFLRCAGRFARAEEKGVMHKALQAGRRGVPEVQETGRRENGKGRHLFPFSRRRVFFIRRRVRRADGWRMTWGHKKTCFPPFPSDGSGRKHACSVFTYRSRFRGGHLRSRLCLLYAVGQFGTGFEFYHFLSGNFNFCTSGRVNASAGGTF